MDWRAIASEYEWFPAKNGMPKYSLGIRGRSSALRHDDVLTDPQEIIMQQCCNRVEHDVREELATDIAAQLERMRANVRELESTMDAHGDGNALIAKIRSAAGGDVAAQQELGRKSDDLKAFCKSKCDMLFKQKRVEALRRINEGMNANYDRLAADLERLKARRNALGAQCNEKELRVRQLRECETNPSLANIQRKIFENDEQIAAQKERRQRYRDMLAEQQSDRERLTEEVAVYEQSLVELDRDIDATQQHQAVADEISATTWFLEWISGVAIHKMTASRIELVVVQWFKLSMDYEAGTRAVSNVEWTMHPAPPTTDAFSPHLLAMVMAIGDTLQLTTSIRTVDDLKRTVTDIMELVDGVQDLRRTLTAVHESLNVDYKPMIHPLNGKVEAQNGELVVKLTMARYVEYQSGGAAAVQCPQRMKSKLLVHAVFRFTLGYPRKAMQPMVSTVLVRQLFVEKEQKFKSIKDRVPLMFIEKKLNERMEQGIGSVAVGANLFARCVNAIQAQMDVIVDNELHCKHDIGVYD